MFKNYNYKFHTLKNGLKIVTLEMKEANSVAIGMWIKAGSRFETQKLAGAAHFIEHILFKGSKKFSMYEVKELIEGSGGTLNAFTSEENTCLFAKVLPDKLDIAIDVLADMIISAKFDKAEVEKERQVILEEIKMYKDLPHHVVSEKLDELLWPNHPLGRPIIGNEKIISGMSLQELIEFKEKYYNPSNIVVSVTGNFKESNLLQLIEKTFKKEKKGSEATYVRFGMPDEECRIDIAEKQIEQTHITLGVRTFDRFDKDNFSLNTANIAIGGNMSSRLFNEVREKRGLAYAISSDLKKYMDTGAFIVSAGIDNKKVLEALEVIVEELRKFKVSDISEKELERAKEYYAGHFLMMLEETLAHMIYIGEKVVMGEKILSISEIIKKIKSIKPGDIKNVMQKVFHQQKIKLATIGPLNDKAREEIKKRFQGLKI